MTDDFRGPAAKKFDWQHILERHSLDGVIAQQSGLKTTFSMTDNQIKRRVMAAWRNRSRIKSQSDPLGVERILYRGTAPRAHEEIEFWYNADTKTVETAYPVRAR